MSHRYGSELDGTAVESLAELLGIDSSRRTVTSSGEGPWPSERHVDRVRRFVGTARQRITAAIVVGFPTGGPVTQVTADDVEQFVVRPIRFRPTPFEKGREGLRIRSIRCIDPEAPCPIDHRRSRERKPDFPFNPPGEVIDLHGSEFRVVSWWYSMIVASRVRAVNGLDDLGDSSITDERESRRIRH